MPADRTTIRATIDELLVKFRENLTADPVTAAKPFRRVVVGAVGNVEFSRPFLAVNLTRARPLAATDGDKIMEVTAVLRIVTDVVGADAHGELLGRVAAVDDYLDGLLETGVISGADGFDDRLWVFAEPEATSGARVAVATATQAFVVKVARGQNRVPA